MDTKGLISRLRAEEGQVLVYILKIFLVAAVIGAVIIQFGPVVLNHITVGKLAGNAAEEGALAYRSSRGNMEEVNRVIRQYLDDHDARLNGSVSIEYDAGRRPAKITVPVRRITNTWLFENVGYLSPYTEAKGFGDSPLNY